MTRTLHAARAAALATALLAAAPLAGWAQDAAAPADPAKLQALEAQVRTLTGEASDKQGQIDALQQQLAERNARISALTSQATDTAAQAKVAQDRLAEAEAALAERNGVLARQRAELLAARNDLASAEAKLEGKDKEVAALAAGGRELVAARDEAAKLLAERDAQLAEQRAQLLAARNDLGSAEAQLAGRDKEVAALAAAGRELVAARDEAAKLLGERNAQVAELRAQLLAARNDLGSAETQLAGRDREVAALAAAGRELVAARDEAAKLLAERDAQLAELRAQLLAARNDLGSAETQLAGKDKEVAALVTVGRELVAANEALEQELEDLSGPEDAFLAGLQEAFGPETRVRLEDDRLIFPSDVAFVSGSAKLTPAAREKALELGRTIAAATAVLPADSDWVLRIDGHTDRQPVGGRLFASNRELSAARALEVVEVLSEAGVPPERLVPAAFGEFRPLDPADTPEAYQANRRIELQLDAG